MSQRPDEAERADGTPKPMTTAVLLLGRGGYSDSPAADLAVMTDAVRATGLYQAVTSAMVDQGEPSLAASLDTLAADGASRIAVIPVFMPGDDGLELWLAKQTRSWLRRREGPPVDVVLGGRLGAQTATVDAVTAVVARTIDGPSVWVDAPVDRGDPTWSLLPRHRHHALVCRGPRCTARGADLVWRRLVDRLGDEGLDRGRDQTLVVQTSCQYPCNLGPMMAVYPAGVWYGDLDVASIDRIVADHLSGGEVIEEWAIRPGARRKRASMHHCATT